MQHGLVPCEAGALAGLACAGNRGAALCRRQEAILLVSADEKPEFALGALQGSLRLHHADCAGAGDGAAQAHKPSGVAAAQLVYGWAMLWHVMGKGGATRQAYSKGSARDDCWATVWPLMGRQGVGPQDGLQPVSVTR